MSFGADWTCSCGWANLDVRPKCRNCGAANPDYVPPSSKLALAKPASSPAGGDVREALEAAFDFLGGVDGASEVRDKLLAALQSTSAGRVPDPADLNLLMRLQRDNTHDGARPVINRQVAIDQAFRLSEEGLIALEQVAQGVRLHITRKGVQAIRLSLATEPPCQS